MMEVVLGTVWLLFICKNIIGGFEMIEIGRVGELDKASNYPKEVQEKILEAVEIFTVNMKKIGNELIKTTNYSYKVIRKLVVVVYSLIASCFLELIEL